MQVSTITTNPGSLAWTNKAGKAKVAFSHTQAEFAPKAFRVTRAQGRDLEQLRSGTYTHVLHSVRALLTASDVKALRLMGLAIATLVRVDGNSMTSADMVALVTKCKSAKVRPEDAYKQPVILSSLDLKVQPMAKGQVLAFLHGVVMLWANLKPLSERGAVCATVQTWLAEVAPEASIRFPTLDVTDVVDVVDVVDNQDATLPTIEEALL